MQTYFTSSRILLTKFAHPTSLIQPLGYQLPHISAPCGPKQGCVVVGVIPHGVYRLIDGQPLLNGRGLPGSEPAIQIPAGVEVNLER
jgi:hypothetical protein